MITMCTQVGNHRLNRLYRVSTYWDFCPCVCVHCRYCCTYRQTLGTLSPLLYIFEPKHRYKHTYARVVDQQRSQIAIGHCNPCGERRFWGPATLLNPRRWVPSVPLFGIPAYAHTVCSRTTRFNMVTHMWTGEVYFCGTSHVPNHSRIWTQRSQFLIYAHTI